MQTMTADSVLQLIEQLQPTEQARLDQLLKQRAATVANGATPPALQPIPLPDGALERQWLATHKRDYANQWVALDGDRLIAASPNHDEVWAAAQADGAHLPLITFIEDPDHLTHIIWA